jgi:hypothetical protein
MAKRALLSIVSAVLMLVPLLVSVAAASPASASGPPPQPTATRSFTFVNTSAETVWVGVLNNPGHPLPEDGGFQLDPGTSRTLDLPDNWAGRFWPRTGCTFDANGNGTCETGDCARGLKCGGAGGIPPVSLAEITLNGSGDQDYFDVSFVDGYNVPMRMKPIGGQPDPNNPYWCTEGGCATDLLSTCPEELRQYNGSGRVVACHSACNKFNTDQYCCRGAYGTPETCLPDQWPVNYARFFKSACPKAYSYAYDDRTSTFFCRDCGYEIIFGT